MKKYCLIGERLDYSLSPLMHNSLFSLTGMDASYHNLECKPDELEAVAQRLRSEYSGANVTVPYKTAIIPYLDEVTGNAKQCGAVNTIINCDGRLIGDCTDGEGFIKALGIDLKDKRVLLLGSGGAARAILVAIINQGGIVDVLNRNRENAVAMLNSISREGVDTFKARVVQEPLLDYSVTVNATPAGSVKYPDQIPNIPRDIKKAGYVYDCVYSPNPTKLLARAKENGNECQNGLSMLLWQGVLAQWRWGNSFNKEIIDKVYSIMEENNK